MRFTILRSILRGWSRVEQEEKPLKPMKHHSSGRVAGSAAGKKNKLFFYYISYFLALGRARPNGPYLE